MAVVLSDVDYTFTATNQPFLTATTNALIISKATVLNTDTTNRKITISRVSAGGTATLVVSGTGTSASGVIAPGQTQKLPLSGFVLSMSESLNGFASAGSKVNVSVSYIIPG